MNTASGPLPSSWMILLAIGAVVMLLAIAGAIALVAFIRKKD